MRATIALPQFLGAQMRSKVNVSRHASFYNPLRPDGIKRFQSTQAPHAPNHRNG
jgi:hypothetical protein